MVKWKRHYQGRGMVLLVPKVSIKEGSRIPLVVLDVVLIPNLSSILFGGAPF